MKPMLSGIYLTGLLSFCLLTPFTALAQNKVYYTVETGVTISNFNSKTAPFPDPSTVEGFDKASRISLELGTTVNYLLSDIFAASAGLRYTEKGGSYKTKNPNFIYIDNFSGAKSDDAYNYLRYRLVYMEIPVLLKINMYRLFHIATEASDVNLYGGVSGMLNIGSKFRYNTFSADAEESWEAQQLKGAEDLALSWIAGAEWSGGPFMIYARFSRNIGAVYNTAEPGYENFDLDMNTISIGLGFIIN